MFRVSKIISGSRVDRLLTTIIGVLKNLIRFLFGAKDYRRMTRQSGLPVSVRATGTVATRTEICE